jgi:hypothetical protein
LGKDLAFCTLRSSNFSVASGGLYDIKRYSETSFHKKAVTATNKTPQLHQFIPTKSVDDQMTRAETLFSNFVAEHNLLSFNYKVQFCALKGDTQNLPLRRVGRGEISPQAVPRG